MIGLLWRVKKTKDVESLLLWPNGELIGIH